MFSHDLALSVDDVFGLPLVRKVAKEKENKFDVAMEIDETEEGFYVEVLTQGYPQESLRVTVEGGVLSIVGERKATRTKKWHGSFKKEIHLS